MSVIAGWLLPHPPLIFPEVGSGREKEISDTVKAFKDAANEIAKASPDAIVIVSPHATMYADYFHILPGERAAGDMLAFGVAGLKIEAELDTSFAEALSLDCSAGGFPAGALGGKNKGLDHGVTIPVRFINEAFAELSIKTPKYVIGGISGLPVADHYRFGMYIAETAARLDKKTIVIASGDLSHRLSNNGPYGYRPEGPEYDRLICGEDGLAKDADFSRLLEMDEVFLEKAGECGHRPLVVLAGAFDRKNVTAKLYSYEGPFGVGYGIVSFTAADENSERGFLDKYLNDERARVLASNESESVQVKLARETVENYIRTNRLYKNREPLPAELAGEKAGVFVSIKKGGQLRGCIGTISPVTENIGEEIRANAVSAATRDPRFEAISEDELPYLEYSVDVLAPAEPIESEDELDPERYGVIVSLGMKRGLLLPNLEGIEDAGEQVGIAMRKAGISENDRARIKLERFEVIRYK